MTDQLPLECAPDRPRPGTRDRRHHRYVGCRSLRGDPHLRGPRLLLHRQPAAELHPPARRARRAARKPHPPPRGRVRRARPRVLRRARGRAQVASTTAASTTTCCSSRPTTRRCCAASRRRAAVIPLCEEGEALLDGIRAERAALGEIRARADVIIDTTELVPRELRDSIRDRYFNESLARTLAITVSSFGFKYGLPVDADIVMDVRFLPEPVLRPRAAALHRPRRAGPRVRARQLRDRGLPVALARRCSRRSCPATSWRASTTSRSRSAAPAACTAASRSPRRPPRSCATAATASRSAIATSVATGSTDERRVRSPCRRHRRRHRPARSARAVWSTSASRRAPS